MKWLFTALAWLCVGLGFLGVFLPLLPTTPFLLLALFLFARSSPRGRAMLMRHRILGPYIRGYASKAGLSVRAKATTLAVMWAAMLFSVVFIARNWWLRALLLAIAAGVSVHILLKKTRRGSSTEAENP